MNYTLTHTPGPWTAETTDRTGVAGYMVTARVACIASVSNLRGHARVNARLIAAAPDLLAALEGIMPVVEAYVPYRSDGWHFKLVEAARAALRKAQGLDNA